MRSVTPASRKPAPVAGRRARQYAISETLRPHPQIYIGLFVVTLTTVMYEILLTRIFSVTMWYHFAFVAVSVAMFGLTVGALAVYLRPGYFADAQVARRLGATAFGFSASVVLTFLNQLWWPIEFQLSVSGVVTAVVFYAALSVPFAFGGVCVCLALTRFPGHVRSLYAADLIGAGAGCAVLVPLLEVTDGPTAVLVVASVAALGAWIFLVGRVRGWLPAAAIVTAVGLAGLAVAHTVLVHRQSPLLRLQWVKGSLEPAPLYEKWNSFSRITVHGDPARPTPPRGWGLSAVAPEAPVRQLSLLIDAGAGTVLTAFDGRPEAIEHLKYDITNLPHYLRRNARAVVIGAGGGRDVLSALAFGQPSVVAVEINHDIIDIVNNRFGGFTGHLDRAPGVRFVHDEGRSYLARAQQPFDIIQLSLIDTWAATAAGAFVLTENTLYTVNAWHLFLERLTPHGILTVSRFYFRDRPDEIYRLTALASTSLMRAGIQEPRRHVAVVRQLPRRGEQPARVGMATLMVGRSPFSEVDLDTLEVVSRSLGFDVVLSPRMSLDPVFTALASGHDLGGAVRAFPANIAAPTDDSPFFFHTLRLRDVFRPARSRLEADNINMRAVSVLGALLIAVLTLTAACIVVPLVLTSRAADLRNSAPLFVFFGSIGLGFMLVEISQMQRLVVFLGHPTYGLSVVLFSLLVAGGVGSLLVGVPRSGDAASVSPTPLLMLLGVLVVFGLSTPSVIEVFRGAVTPVRIAIAVGMLVPVGLLMGMAFPLGMALATRRSAGLTPWLWGINGATSVCASVLAVVIALGAGISAAFWTGAACYVVAALAFVVACAGAKSNKVTGHA